MVRGRGGIFEVTLDNESLFSKRRSGRFPRQGEVEEILAARLGEQAGAASD